MKKIRVGRAGFGLMEAVIAMGVVGIVSLAVMQLMTLTAKTQRNTLMSQDFNALVNNLTMLLSNESTCTAALGGGQFDFDPAQPHNPVAQIALPGGLVIATKGSATKAGVQLTNIELTPTSVTGTAVAGGLTQYIANLHIDGTKDSTSGKGNYLGSSNLSRDFLIFVQVDAQKKIQACNGSYSPAQAAAAACAAVGGIYNGATCSVANSPAFVQNVCAAVKGTYDAVKGCQLPIPAPAPASGPAPAPAPAKNPVTIMVAAHISTPNGDGCTGGQRSFYVDTQPEAITSPQGASTSHKCVPASTTYAITIACPQGTQVKDASHLGCNGGPGSITNLGSSVTVDCSTACAGVQGNTSFPFCVFKDNWGGGWGRLVCE